MKEKRSLGRVAAGRAPALALILVLAASRGARALDDAVGTGGAAFTKIGIGSARAMALGRAYVALAEGADALSANPAGLALAQQREFAYSYMRYVQDISAPMYMAYAHPVGRTVFGAHMSYLNVDGFDVRDDLGRPQDNSNVRVQDGFGAVAVARSFWYEKLFLGGAIKALHEDNDGAVHDVTVFDFGGMLKPFSRLSLGFAMQNYGTKKERAASVARWGAALRVLELLTVSGELADAQDGGARVSMGAEFILPEDLVQFGHVALRLGYYGADDMGKVLEKDRSFLYPLVGSPKLSFGLGVYTAQAFGYGVSFDYALVSMGALGTADQLSLKVRF